MFLKVHIQPKEKVINDNLEAQAKMIYDYWFNQFEFPNVEGKPYKSSKGKMIWNDELKKYIPCGWAVSHFNKLCKLQNGINYDKKVPGDQEYKIINVRNISSSTLMLNQSDFDSIILPKKQADRYLVKQADIIIARSGVPGATRLLMNPDKNVIYCGFIICCTPNEPIHKTILTYQLKSLEGSNATKTGGSIMQNVSQETLNSLLVVIPDLKTLTSFNRTIEKLHQGIQTKLNENRELVKLRDYLLPLLMNGQITIK